MRRGHFFLKWISQPSSECFQKEKEVSFEIIPTRYLFLSLQNSFIALIYFSLNISIVFWKYKLITAENSKSSFQKNGLPKYITKYLSWTSDWFILVGFGTNWILFSAFWWWCLPYFKLTDSSWQRWIVIIF